MFIVFSNMFNLCCIVYGVDLLCVVMVLVIFEKCVNIVIGSFDVYVLIVGGVWFIELVVDFVIVIVVVGFI